MQQFATFLFQRFPAEGRVSPSTVKRLLNVIVDHGTSLANGAKTLSNAIGRRPELFRVVPSLVLMSSPLPLLQPVPIFKTKDYREVLRREMDGGKIPLSLGKSCPGEVCVLLRDRPFLP